MNSSSSSRHRELLEPQRDAGRKPVAGLLQAAAAVFRERRFEAATTAEKADGLFDNYRYSDQFGWDF
jgi:hypothetical protein